MILVTRQARSLNLYFHKKCLRCFGFTNKSLYNETIDFDIHVGHFAYLDQHAKDEHFNPFLEGNAKLEEKHQLEAQTNHQVLANIRVVDPAREFGSQGFGNVAWKERVVGWKMKQEKNVVPMSTRGHDTSEGRGSGDIDSSTDINMDDSLLDWKVMKDALACWVASFQSTIHPLTDQSKVEACLWVHMKQIIQVFS